MRPPPAWPSSRPTGTPGLRAGTSGFRPNRFRWQFQFTLERPSLQHIPNSQLTPVAFIYGLTISTIARLLVCAATCAALPVLRRKDDPNQAFRISGGVPIAGAAIVLTLWLLSNNTGQEARDSVIAAAAGMAIFAAYRYTRTTRRH